MLARIAGIGHFKIAMFEIGDGQLLPDEQERISRRVSSACQIATRAKRVNIIVNIALCLMWSQGVHGVSLLNDPSRQR